MQLANVALATSVPWFFLSLGALMLAWDTSWGYSAFFLPTGGLFLVGAFITFSKGAWWRVWIAFGLVATAAVFFLYCGISVIGGLQGGALAIIGALLALCSWWNGTVLLGLIGLILANSQHRMAWAASTIVSSIAVLLLIPTAALLFLLDEGNLFSTFLLLVVLFPVPVVVCGFCIQRYHSAQIPPTT